MAVCKVGSFLSQASTGNQTVTHSLGVSPQVIIFWSSYATPGVGIDAPSAGNPGFMYGAMTGGKQACAAAYTQNNQANSTCDRSTWNNRCIVGQTNGNTFFEASRVTFNSTTFTVNWHKALANVKVHYMVIGGLTSASVDLIAGRTSTGNMSYTNPGFRPDAIIFAGSTNTTLNTSFVNVISVLGFCDSDLNQSSINWWSQDNQASSNCGRAFTNDYAIRTRWLDAEFESARVTSYDDTGFTMAWDIVWALAYQYIAISLRGVNAKSTVRTFPSSTGSIAYSTGFRPAGILFSSAAVAPGVSTSGFWGFGGSDGTNNMSSAGSELDNRATSTCRRYSEDDEALALCDNTAVTANGAVTAINNSGYTMTWDITPGTSQSFNELAFEASHTPTCTPNGGGYVGVWVKDSGEAGCDGFYYWSTSTQRYEQIDGNWYIYIKAGEWTFYDGDTLTDSIYVGDTPNAYTEGPELATWSVDVGSAPVPTVTCIPTHIPTCASGIVTVAGAGLPAVHGEYEWDESNLGYASTTSNGYQITIYFDTYWVLEDEGDPLTGTWYYYGQTSNYNQTKGPELGTWYAMNPIDEPAPTVSCYVPPPPTPPSTKRPFISPFISPFREGPF